MSLKQVVSSIAVSAIAAGSLVPLSSAASAGEWNHHGRSHPSAQLNVIQQHMARNEHNGEHSGARFNRWGEHRQYNAWRGNEGDEGEYRHHRNHNGRNVAIGAFAAILGLAIAAEANRGHDRGYDND
jgi:Ni/Co efflux regulator RcnB